MIMLPWSCRRLVFVLATCLVLPVTGDERADPFLDQIKNAAAVSRELEGVSQTPPDTDPAPPSKTVEDSPAKVPLRSQVRQYFGARPWSLAYLDRRRREFPTDMVPASLDARHNITLRGLLKNPSPEVRGLAAEALATFYQPDDAPFLAELLDDAAPSTPIITRDRTMRSSGVSSLSEIRTTEILESSFDWSRRWQQQTVSAYAKDGLKLLTGRDFADKAAFHQWWQHNADARHCLWYWQLRMQRAMDEIDYRFDINLSPDLTERAKQIAAARIPVARAILGELKQLPPEVEAKVRLLAATNHLMGPPITGSEELFWPEPPELRLPPERLLDLLDRKDLWEDVDWDRGHYSLLAQRLGMWADVLFKPQHAGRLQAALERERSQLGWSGQTALIIGISRLHPTAKAGNLDESGTRDQILRHAAVNEPDLFVRAYCAKELVRIGLPENAAFLQSIAFEPTKDHGSPDVMQSILQALARPPFDKPKRTLLADLVLDDRFSESWTRKNRVMGDDMNRTYAVLAINAQLGRTLITDEQRQALVQPPTSAATLEKLRADIKQQLATP